MDYTDIAMEPAISKLILLYIIDKIEMSISNLQITRLVLGNDLINYFFLQQYLNELRNDNFLATEVVNKKNYYFITNAGKNTLKNLSHLIPDEIKNKIDHIIKISREKIKKETLITADFIPESENKYSVVCAINEEDFNLIELKIAAGNKNEARIICENWKNYSQYIYPEIIESLTKKRD